MAVATVTGVASAAFSMRVNVREFRLPAWTESGISACSSRREGAITRNVLFKQFSCREAEKCTDTSVTPPSSRLVLTNVEKCRRFDAEERAVRSGKAHKDSRPSRFQV